MLIASLGQWLTHHAAYADWGVAIGTFALALATVTLAWQARSEAKKVAQQAGISAEQVEISRAALEAQVRPILIDVAHGSAPSGPAEFVPYESGVPDGGKHVSPDAVDVDALENGHFICSVPLRNAGAGLAVITDDPRLTHPARDADFIGRLKKQVVPPREQTRAYFGPGVPLETPEDATLIVKVPYTDASGSNILWTEATLNKRDDVWRVIQVSIRLDGEDEPLAVSAAAV